MTVRGIGWAALLVACATASCSWEQDSPPGPFVTLEELDASAQPTTAALGVLIAVSAFGGSVLHLEVEGGTLDRDGTSKCIPVSGAATFVVAVHPTVTDAVLTATLGDLEPGPASKETGVEEAEASQDTGSPDASSASDALDLLDASGPSEAGSRGASDGSPETPEASAGAAPIAVVTPVLEATASCEGRPFRPDGVGATLAISLGRAPAPPPSDEAGVDATMTTPLDAGTESDAADAEPEIGLPSDAAMDGFASADASDGGDSQ